MATYTETLKRVMADDFADTPEHEKDTVAQELIMVCSVGSAAVTVQPFPLVDTALIGSIQVGLVQGLARVRSQTLDRRSVVELLSVVGASLVAQNLLMAGAKLVPFVGWIVSISTAYGLTWAVGEVSDYYFLHDQNVDKDELRDMFRRIYQDKKAEKEEANARNRALKNKLDRLTKDRKRDKIDDDDYEAEKAELLTHF